ncbi:MAG: O-antigen ligase family protein [bacterium]
MRQLEAFKNELAAKPLLWLVALILAVAAVIPLATPYPVAAVAPGLVLVILLISGRFAQFGFFVLVFMIPLDAFTEFSAVYPTLSISKFLGIWIVMVALTTILTRKKWPDTLRSNLWPALLAMVIVSFLSFLYSDHYLTVLDNLRKLFVAILFFGLTLIFVDSEKAFKTLLPKVLVFSAAFGAVLSLLGHLFGISWLVMNVDPDPTVVNRATGAASDPNMFSMMILFSIPLGVHLLFSAATLRRRLFWGMLFLMEMATLILTYSRSAAMVLCLLLLLLGMRYRRHLKPRYTGLVAAGFMAGVILVAVMVPSSYWERHKQALSHDDTSVQRRLSYLAVGRDEFLRCPFLGSGLGTFEIAYANSKYAFTDPYDLWGETARRAAHNVYVEILVGTGLLGLAVFLLIIGLAWRNFRKAAAWSRAGGNEELASVILAYQFAFMAILLHLLSLSSFNHKYLWMSLALSQAALTVAQRVPKAQSHEYTLPVE